MVDPKSIEYSRIMGKETMQDSPNDDAEIFLKGNCHMFALALHDIKKYKIYKWDGASCHYFCIEKGKFVDVRGVTDKMITAIGNHEVLPDEIEMAEEYQPNDEIEAEAYEFACKIINSKKYGAEYNVKRL